MTLQPALQGAEIFFTGIVLHETAPNAAGGVVDYGDQMAGGAAILQPAEGRAVHHHQFAECGTALAPHMHLPDLPAARPPQSRGAHPLSQCLPAHPQPVLRQMLGGECGTETRVRRQPQPSQTAVRDGLGNLAIRGTSAQPMNQPAIPLSLQACRQAPDAPVGQPQTPRRFDLREVALLDFVQHLQSVPFSLAQRDSLRFHGALGHP